MVHLQPGQVCANCESAAAWSRGDKLVISMGDLEEAERRIAGESAPEPLGLRVGRVAPLLAAVGLAVGAGYCLSWLLGPRALDGLDVILDDLDKSVWATLGLGLAATITAAVALRVIRRSRLHRAWLPISGALGSFALGLVATVIGIMHLGAVDGFGLAHTALPERASLGVLSPEVERIVAATTVIQAPNADGDALTGGLGTGAVVHRTDERAWVVTCRHVAIPHESVGIVHDNDSESPVRVTFADGRSAEGVVTWAAPPPLDVAILEIPIDDPPEAVEVGRSLALGPGADVLYVPLPLRHGWIVREGEVTRRRSHETPAGNYTLLYTNLPVLPGDSGSGLYDAAGRLVGLNTWTRLGIAGPQGISLPSEAVALIVEGMAGASRDATPEKEPSP